jgi:hypothetical protein
MANSFSATALDVDYRVKLHTIESALRDEGIPCAVRERIRDQEVQAVGGRE